MTPDATGLDAATRAIIRLAWCRRLGLPDDALEAADPQAPGSVEEDTVRVEVERAGGEFGLIRLFGRAVLVGPGSLLSAARELSGAELTDPTRWPDLLTRAGLTGVRIGEPETLAYLDDYQPVSGSPLISDESSAASILAGRCPPDDRIGIELADLPARFVLLDEADGQRPVAGAGYAEAGGLLGRLQVLTARSHRRRGLGATVSRIAVNDALDAGLIVEGWLPCGHPAAVSLSESVGFSPSGCRIWST